MTSLTTQDGYEAAVADIRRSINERPDEMVRRATITMEQLRETHAARRIEFEAVHRSRLNDLDDHYTALKNEVNGSIKSLEHQLGQLRNEWARLNETHERDKAVERERWQREDQDQRKLINAEQVMIDHLKS